MICFLKLRSSESHFSVTPSDETTTVSGLQLPNPKNNGSIITMTLKNNHLIVETEETTVSFHFFSHT